MSVYVDTLIRYAKEPAGYTGRARSEARWCHMFADSLDELTAMADRIGLRRAWFQDDARLPHYDLVPSKRALAIRCGAVEAARAEVVARMRAKRGGPWPPARRAGARRREIPPGSGHAKG